MGGIGVALAICVGLASSFIQSLGLTIQRKSHLQNDALPIASQKRPIRRPLWIFGFGIYITSNIFATIFQLDALPIVILAPLGAVSLIYNALLARLILGDRFGLRMIIGTFLVAVGATLIAVFGVVQEADHSIDELRILWNRPAFLAFFWVIIGLTLITLIIAHVVSFFTYRSLRSIRLDIDETRPITPPPIDPPSNYASPHDPAPIPFQPTNRRWSAPPVASSYTDSHNIISHTQPAADTPEITRKSPLKPIHTVRFADLPQSPGISPNDLDTKSMPVTYAEPTPAQQKTITSLGLTFAAASGILSGMSLVLAKAAVELLVLTLDYLRTGKGKNQFTHPISWLLVAGLASGGLAQLVYLNYSLTFASPALICPLAFCFFNLSSIFDGLVFYDQFSRLRPHQIALVSIGVTFLLFGVWVVSVVEPTGQGGIEVGTWAEDEDEMSIHTIHSNTSQSPALKGTETSPLLSEEPSSAVFGSTSQVSNGSYPQPGQISKSTETSPRLPPLQIRPDMMRNNTFPSHDPLPPSTSGVMSPTSPKRRRIRYATLLPDLAPAPAGFSIGIGAASPGFVLRPGSGNHSINGTQLGHAGAGGRARSRSEGGAGIRSFMDLLSPRAPQEAEVPPWQGVQDDEPEVQTEEPETMNGNGGENGAGLLPVEEIGRTSWWRRIWGRKKDGRIALPRDQGEES